MIYEPPDNFQRNLDEFNDSQGGPTKVTVCWNPKLCRWQVYALVQYASSHPEARHARAKKLLVKLPDYSEREGVLLFTWAQRDERGRDIGFLQLDNRIFSTLHHADTYRSRRHFEETVEEPEALREARESKDRRVIAAASAEYYKAYDSPLLSMNPTTKAGASWRHRIR